MIFELEMKVRDYECDLQGIVNNANYQHYYEHTRHEFLSKYDISFSKMHDEGLDFVVARLQMSFKRPLRAGDRFLSVLEVEQQGVRYIFHQKIYTLPERKLCNIATTECVILDHGQLSENEYFNEFVKRVNVSQN